MHPYRIAFVILGGLSLAFLGWAMMRDRIPGGPRTTGRVPGPERPPSTPGSPAAARPADRPPGGRRGGVVGYAAASMSLELPMDSASERTMWFRDVGLTAGVDFQHFSGLQPDQPLPAYGGSGVAAFDFDHDGNHDLYFGTGTPFPLDAQRPQPLNRCYRNLGGWQFTDVTRRVRLDHNGYTTGIAVGDYDNDGFADVYVACYGPDCLFRNMGDGTFLRSDIEAGIHDDQWSTSAVMADIDRDGWLDIYVCNYGKWNWGDPPADRAASPSEFQASDFGLGRLAMETDRIYRNLGDGRFEDLSISSGLAAHPGRSNSVVAADLNEDGWIDFAVAQTPGGVSLRLNQQDGRFEVKPLVLARETVESRSFHGIAASIWDREGTRYLLATRGPHAPPLLLRANASGDYELAPQSANLTADAAGWGCALADINLDGRDDMVIATGEIGPASESTGPLPQIPLAYKNENGAFRAMGLLAGPYFNSTHVGRGLAVVDLDNDGDQDIAITHLDAMPAVLRNSVITPTVNIGLSAMVKLVGTRSSRDAIGARLTAHLGARTAQYEVQKGGSYLSSSDSRIIIAVEVDESPFRAEIRWPDGNLSVLENLEAGQAYTVIEPVRPGTSAPVFSRFKRSS